MKVPLTQMFKLEKAVVVGRVVKNIVWIHFLRLVRFFCVGSNFIIKKHLLQIKKLKSDKSVECQILS